MRRRPNILVFMSDQQRGDTVLPGARLKAHTPHLDRFRAEGLTFSRCYGPSPHCCPSRATFWTGLMPTQHGVWNNVSVQNALSRGLNPGVRLWTEALRATGYNLHWTGKWHISNDEGPADWGFQVHSLTAGPKKGGFGNMGLAWEDYKKPKRLHEKAAAASARGGLITRPGYPDFWLYGTNDQASSDDAQVAAGRSALQSATTGTDPWLLFVGTIGPHDPYFPPSRYLQPYQGQTIDVSPSFDDHMEDKPTLYRRARRRFDQVSRAEQAEAVRHYLAYSSYEDALFGELLDDLERSGQAENTIVLYLSDHGDYVTDHGLWTKGLPCFESAYHVPAMIRWPQGLTQPGRTVDAFISLADIGPTLLDLTDTPGAESFDFAGRSLLPFVQGEPPTTWRDAIFTQTNGNELYGIQRSIRTEDWKFVYNGFDDDELYDLRADPHETRNLAQQGEHGEVIRELSARLWRFAHDHRDTCINQYIMTALAQYGPASAFQ